MVTKVQVHSNQIEVTLDQMGVAMGLDAESDKQQLPYPNRYYRDRHLMVLTIPARLKRTGIEIRLVIEDGSEPANVDPAPPSERSRGSLYWLVSINKCLL